MKRPPVSRNPGPVVDADKLRAKLGYAFAAGCYSGWSDERRFARGLLPMLGAMMHVASDALHAHKYGPEPVDIEAIQRLLHFGEEMVDLCADLDDHEHEARDPRDHAKAKVAS